MKGYVDVADLGVEKRQSFEDVVRCAGGEIIWERREVDIPRQNEERV